MDKTQAILNIFEQISAVPRGSKREAQISRWLQDWAAERGFSAATDKIGNLLIRIPATKGFEQAPVVVLQGHMDMVCEKTPDSPHDFLTDPIRCIVEGDWLHADRTTLGADNGIAIALALALVEDQTVGHPPLELLFTVEEEIGIGGASYLQPGFVRGRVMVNLDSEDEGVFTVGCAGGQKTSLALPFVLEALPPTGQAFTLKVSGLQGGHSGLDIDKHFASANKILARALNQAWKAAHICLVTLKGGSAHNAIAREAEAVIVCAQADETALRQAISQFEQMARSEYSTTEKTLAVSLTPAEAAAAMPSTDTNKVIQLLLALPHGVADMSASIPGFVETSNNLATLKVEDQQLKIVSSQRSTVMSRLEALTSRIEAVGALTGAMVNSDEAYPAWEPDMESALLGQGQAIYQQLFGTAPEVKMIHAGLECGIIGKKYPGMDMISIGATLKYPHSPNERLYIPSVGKVWAFLVALLADFQAQ